MTRTASKIRFKAKLLRPAATTTRGSWTFLVLPRIASAQLPTRGMTTVEGNINGYPFQATSAPLVWNVRSQAVIEETRRPLGDTGMKRRHALALGTLLMAAPSAAHAHGISPWMAAAALSPLLVLLLAAILAWLRRSVRTGAIHGALILVWVGLFWVASNTVTSDYIIWAPLLTYLLHSAIILMLVVWHVYRRSAARRRDEE